MEKINVIFNPFYEWSRKKAYEIKEFLKKSKPNTKENIYIVIGGDGTIAFHKKKLKNFISIGHDTTFAKSLPMNSKPEEINQIIKKEKKIPLFPLKITAYTKEGKTIKEEAIFDSYIKTKNQAITTKGILQIKNKMIDYQGDGIIISTPLGSTAYNKTAGGPQLPLSSHLTAISCICCTKRFQPIVLNGEEKIKIKILSPSVLFVDNRELTEKIEYVELYLGKEPRWFWWVKDEQSIAALL